MDKNLHLVPQMVIDLAEKLPNSSDSERFMLTARLEAIRDFCDKAIKQPPRKGNAKHT